MLDASHLVTPFSHRLTGDDAPASLRKVARPTASAVDPPSRGRPSFVEDLPLPEREGGAIWLHQGNRYDHPRHRHEAIELNLVVAGRSHYEVAGRRVPLGPGSLLWIYPDQDHEQAERSHDFQMWIVALGRELLTNTCADGPARPLLERLPPADQCRHLPWADASWLDRELEHLASRGSAQVVRAGLSYCVLAAWETYCQARPDAPVVSAEVQTAMTLIETEPSLSRQELADRLELCPTRLTRAFTKELGVTLSEYRTRVRVERFAGLIESRRMSHLDACFRAGFGSYAQCHRAFVGHMGCSPRDYVARSGRGSPAHLPPTCDTKWKPKPAAPNERTLHPTR